MAAAADARKMDEPDPLTLRLILQYTAERERLGRISHKTALDMRSALVRFAQQVPLSPKQITFKHAENWVAAAKAPASKRQRLTYLRGWTRWCVLNGHMRSDPCLKVEPAKLPPRAPRSLPTEEVTRLLDSLPDPRAKVICLLMAQEGLRCIEVAGLQLGDVDLERGIIGVRGKGGQGGVTRSLPLSAETKSAIEAYLLWAPASAGPLVRAYCSELPLDEQYISMLVSDWMKGAGIKKQARDGRSAHALRHTMASHMIDNGAPILVVSQALGHASIATTQIYLRGVTPELRQWMSGRSYSGKTPLSEEGAQE